MSHVADRRSVLKGALGGLIGVAAPSLVLAGCGGGAEASLPVTPLAGRVALLGGAGANLVALSSQDGVVLVDSGAPEHAASVIASARRMPNGGRVHTLFNTHYHLDQTGANEAIAAEGAQIVAHERVEVRLTRRLWNLETLEYDPARPAAAPTETFYTLGEKIFGEETVEYGYLPQPHTDGDAYVFFRDSDVIAAGDAASPERDPVHDWVAGGWLGGRVDALAQILALAGEDTLIVPSYGPVMSKAEVQAEHDMMLTLHERTVDMLRRGFSAEDMVDEGALDGLGRTFADPATLMRGIWKGLWAHQSSLSHDIV